MYHSSTSLSPSSSWAFNTCVSGCAVVPSPDIIQQACTHPSFVQLHTQQHPDQPLPATNASLATLGNSLLGLFATEFVNSSYPHLPTRVMKAAVSAHVGPTTCASLAREMGAMPILRWHRSVRVIHFL